MSKRAKPGGATQTSVGEAFCALTGLTAAAATAVISLATNRKKMAILSLLKKITTCLKLRAAVTPRGCGGMGWGHGAKS